MSYQPAPFLSVLYCDDARQEVTGKAILVGVYRGDLIVRALPAMLPKLHLSVTYAYPFGQPQWAGKTLRVVRGSDVLFARDLPPDAAPHPTTDTPTWVLHFIELDLQPYGIDEPHALTVYVDSEAGTVQAPSLLVRAMRDDEVPRFGDAPPGQALQ